MRFFKNTSKLIGWLVATTFCLAGLLASGFYLYLRPGLPDVEQLRSISLQTPMRIFTHDKKLIAEFGEKRRTPIKLENCPPLLVSAFLAAEDNRFYEHHGVDFKGLLRAVSQLASSGQIQSGGSTITMQVAKNFFLSREKTFIRKFNEILLAFQIENELTKGEILELYLNKIYLGNRAYGVEAAAQVYYGKSVSDLSLPEMAMIAGLPKAPSRYNPLANAKRADDRRDWIVSRMLELGFITQAEHDAAIAAPVTASYHGPRLEAEAPYVAEMTRQFVFDWVKTRPRNADNSELDPYSEGLQITLTIDSVRQQAANEAVRKGLEDYDRRHGYRGAEANWRDSVGDTTHLQAQIDEVPALGRLLPAVVIGLNEDGAQLLVKNHGAQTLPFAEMRWARKFLNDDAMAEVPRSAADVLAVGDVIRVIPHSQEDGSTRYALGQVPDAQATLISLSPRDGALQALVGGYDFYQSKYNRATQADRQPGSNFKPFIYLAALENGATAATVINDAPIVLNNNQDSDWRPENSSGEFYGPTRLRKALYNSRNLVSIRLLQEIGINKTVAYLSNLGFDRSKLPSELSLALGSAGMPPMTIASGYAMLANGGSQVTPYWIESIATPEGEPVYTATPRNACVNCVAEGIENPAPRVADARAVYIIQSILQDVIRYGTGRKAQALGRTDLAGKTGTTNDQKDAWFSGFNHNLATTVWVGFDQPRTLGRREFGAVAALPIWSDYMAVALKDQPPSFMPQPAGLVTIKIDPDSGKRAASGASNAIFEVFMEENAPMDVAPENGAQEHFSTDDNSPRTEDLF